MDRSRKVMGFRSCWVAVLFLLFLTPIFAQQGQNVNVSRYENYDSLREVPLDQVGLVSSKHGKYLVHIPGNAARQKLDIVVFMHGRGTNAVSHFEYRKRNNALFSNAIIIMPNGPKELQGRSGLEGFLGAYDWPKRGTDLNQVTKNVIGVTDKIRKKAKIRHVFIGGHSNGARAASRVAMEGAELFDGLFVHEGRTPQVRKPNSKQKSVPIALIVGSAGTTKPKVVKKHREKLNRMHHNLTKRGFVVYNVFVKGKAHPEFTHNNKPVHTKALGWLRMMSKPPGKLIRLAQKMNQRGKPDLAKKCVRLLLNNDKTPSDLKAKAKKLQMELNKKQ